MSRSHRIDLSLLVQGDGEPLQRRVERLCEKLRRQPGVTNAHIVEQETAVDHEIVDDATIGAAGGIGAADGEGNGDGRPATGVRPLLCIHYDPTVVSLRAVVETARRLGSEVADHLGFALVEARFRSPQIAATTEDAAALLPGVAAVSASFGADRLRIEYDTRVTTLDELLGALRRLGVRHLRRPALHSPTEEERARGRRLRASTGLGAARLSIGSIVALLRDHDDLAESLLCGLLLLVGVALEWFVDPLWALPVLMAALVAGGRHTTLDVARSLALRRFDIDLLMLVAAIGASAIGHWAEGALLMFLFSLGHALEHLALERARGAINALKTLAPETALRVAPATGETEEVPSERLAPGDVIIVRPGDRVAADGVVVAGASAIDQSPITGESMPVDKEEGSEVFAGTINGDGALRVRVERPSSDNTLARVIRLVEAAQSEKSRTEVLTDKVNRYYVPFVLAGTVATAIGPPLLAGASWVTWFYRSMALVTGAAPCALAIGTPAAVLSGLARAARGGILIKGGAHLETLGRLRAIAFDKTGTLTEGKPRVAEIVVIGQLTERELLRVAGGVESVSGHPLAAAIVAEARARGLALPEAHDTEQLQGRGIRATVEGEMVEAGNLRMFGDLASIEGGDEVARHVAELEAQGHTTVIVRRGGALVGLIGLRDEIRPKARATLGVLRTLGVERIVMLTGDQERAAEAVGRELGVDEVASRLLPEDKVERVAALVARYGRVAMLGDGVNDAPALAQASVGIAMGTAGSDVALESADVALMGDDLALLPEAIRLSRRSRVITIQNLVIALGTIFALIPAAILGWAPIGWAVFFHEGSTVVVVLNALRLLR